MVSRESLDPWPFELHIPARLEDANDSPSEAQAHLRWTISSSFVHLLTQSLQLAYIAVKMHDQSHVMAMVGHPIEIDVEARERADVRYDRRI